MGVEVIAGRVLAGAVDAGVALQLAVGDALQKWLTSYRETW